MKLGSATVVTTLLTAGSIIHPLQRPDTTNLARTNGSHSNYNANYDIPSQAYVPTTNIIQDVQDTLQLCLRKISSLKQDKKALNLASDVIKNIGTDNLRNSLITLLEYILESGYDTVEMKKIAYSMITTDNKLSSDLEFKNNSDLLEAIAEYSHNYTHAK